MSSGFAFGLLLGVVAGVVSARVLERARRRGPLRVTPQTVVAVALLLVGLVVLGFSLRPGSGPSSHHAAPARAPTTTRATTTTSASVTIPDVVTLPEAQATQQLRQVGLDAVVTRMSIANLPKGVVVSEAPRGGSTATRGDLVQLVVTAT